MKSAVKAAANGLFSSLFPSDCRICTSPLTAISALPVCQPCMARMAPLEGPVCRVCGEKLSSVHAMDDHAPLCGLCRRIPPEFRRAVAYGSYDGELRELIHLFKYDGIRPAAHVLARFLHAAVSPLPLPDQLAVVPVPLWPGKRQARGFNQAEAIARSFVRTGRPKGIQLEAGTLARTRETASQTGLTRSQRRKNVRGAFAVTQPERVRGRHVLLIDDVMTTGTTVNECARVLRRSGAKEVWVATVARATREVQSAMPSAAAAHGGD